MKAILCKSLDGPARLELDEIPEPKPAPGEVIVAVEACALNFSDTLITRGKYQHKPELPFSPGGEIAGTVASVGENAGDWKVGDRVCAYLGWGGAQEFAAVPAERVVAIPDGIDAAVASGVSITYGTAIHGLSDRGNLKPGETVAILGASGGAGLAAVEIAAAMGAEVIAVASSDEKLAVCREHGAKHLVNYTGCNLKLKLRDLTAGRGVDVVYDCVGGESTEQTLRAMAWKGRFLVVGFASGEIPKLPLNLLLVKGCAAIGVFWGEAVKRDPAQHREHMSQVLHWVSDGRLNPRIDKRFPLTEIKNALSEIEDRKAIGKIVLQIQGV